MATPVRESTHGSTGIIELNRPGSRNALNSELMEALPLALTRMDSCSAVSSIVLTGADPAFCAGLDLKELRATGANRRLEDTGRGPTQRVSKPLIAAVNGPAVAGGLELALWCDIIVASERASFVDAHTVNGLIPRWGLPWLLASAVGERRARQMSLTGMVVDASLAVKWGLANEVVAHNELLPRVLEIGAQIANAPAEATRETLAMYEDAAELHRAPAVAVDRVRAMAWNPVLPESSH